MKDQSNNPSMGEHAGVALFPREFAIEEMGKPDRHWRLLIRPGDLALFEGDDVQPFVILREQMQKDVMLMEGMRALVLNKPKKVTLKLPPEAVSAVADWVGAPLLAGCHLKRRYSWVLPVAIIWIVGSLPRPGDSDAGVDATPLDAVGLGLGLVLVVSWAFAKWRPHPVLFLVDSIWFLWLAGYLVHDVFNARSKLWMILAGVLVWMAITGFKHFARFRGAKIETRRL